MTDASPATPSRSLQILKIVLYILAGLVLVLGLIAGISLLTGATSMVANILMPIQLIGGGAFNNLIASTVSSFLINLGVFILIVTLVTSALFYGLGRVIGRVALLEARVARLEARL